MQHDHPPTHGPTVDAPPADLAHQTDRDEWLDESEEPRELPARPRRRLLRPIPLALLGALLIAGGFIAGVQIQKGEQTSTGAAGGAGTSLASRLAALRGGATTAAGGASGRAPASGIPGTGAGGARPTTGTVAYLAGSSLYATNAGGNTVRVNTSAATSVTKTVEAEVKAIHPGETVTVTGASDSSGAVSAESVSVGGGGGLAGLFGGSSSASTGSGTRGGSGGPALFGSG